MRLVLFGALGCSAEPTPPSDPAPPTASADPLATLVARFPGAEAWLDARRPARIEQDAGRWWLRETIAASTAGPWRSLRRELALRVSAGRQIVTSARGVHLVVERDGVASVERQGDALALRDDDGALAGVIYATPRGIEELFVGAGEARYTLELPTGWTMHQPEGRHELVELRDHRGTPQVRLVARWAWDEDGEQHPVRLRVDGDGVIVQTPPDEGPLLIDPEWQDAGTPTGDRVGALITRLSDGRVLLAGGGFSDVFGNGFDPTVTADRFDPRTGTFEALARLPDATSLGSATLLRDGRVLLTGFGFTASPLPVVFLPGSGTFESLAADPLPFGHVAARLPDGRVLFAGGIEPTGEMDPPGIDSLWLFDPKVDTLASAGTMAEPRNQAEAVVLGDGRVLVVGGYHLGQPVLPVERYDPSTQQSEEIGSLASTGEAALLLPHLARFLRLRGTEAVLVDVTDASSIPVGTFDPPRNAVYTALLPDGDALILGGFADPTLTLPSQAHRYDWADDQLVPLTPPPDTFTLTSGAPLPTGDHLVLGDTDEQAWRFEPAVHDVVVVGDNLPFPMTAPSITPLPSGEVLLSEGGDAVRFDPVSRTSSAEPGALIGIGAGHRATVLLDGRVLYTGGLLPNGQATDAAVVYDPSGDGPDVHAMTAPRSYHQQTLLPDGRVLLVGGVAQPVSDFVTSAEIFDPDGGFTSLGPHPVMAYGDALVMSDGKVHLWGGFAPELGAIAGEPILSLFDPSSETFTSGDVLTSVSTLAARLPDGRLFALGGDGTAQVRDPPGAEPIDVMHTFWQLGVDEPLFPPSIVPLPSGKLLVARADSDIMHLVDPVDLSVTTFAEPAGGRRAAALLPDGGVLLAGAIGGGSATLSLSIWYEQPQRDAWRPSLTVPATLTIGEAATLGGTGLLGVSEGVSAFSSGAANAPVAYLLLDGGGIVRGSATDWSATALSFTLEAYPVRGPGTILASPQGLLAGARTVLTLDPDGAACDGASTCASGRCVDGVCCESACDDLCFACAASLKGYGDDGVCELLAPGEPDPHCPQDDVATCKSPGTCDGAGQCAPHYDDFTDCDAGGDRFCYAGECEQRICDGDHTLLFESSTEDCAPYRCVSEPVVGCRTSCGNNLHCVEGFLCDASGQCVAGDAAAEPLGCTPCALGRTDDERASWAWLLLGALLIVRRELSGGHSGAARRRRDDAISNGCRRHGRCERRRP